MWERFSSTLVLAALLYSALADRKVGNRGSDKNEQISPRTTRMEQAPVSTAGTTRSSPAESTETSNREVSCQSLSGREILISVALGVLFGFVAISCLQLGKNRIDACKDSICVDGSPDFTPAQTNEMPDKEATSDVLLNLEPERTQSGSLANLKRTSGDFPEHPVQVREKFTGDLAQKHGMLSRNLSKTLAEPSDETALTYASISF